MTSSTFSRRALPALLAILITGCASTHGLSPKASLGDVDRLSAGNSLAQADISPAAWPDADWWRALGDPNLDLLIDTALTGTPSLDAADARLRKALAQAGLAEAGLKPTLGASAGYTHINVPDALPAPIGGTTVGSTMLSLRFDWSPDLWGGKRARYHAALGSVRAGEAEAQAARVLLAGNIAHAWVSLSQAYALQDVALAEANRNVGLRKLSAQRVKAGIDNRIALERIDSAEAAAHAQAKAAGQQIDALRNTLAMLAGQGPDFGLTLARPRLGTPSIQVPSVLPSDLVSRRADITAARWRVEAAAQSIKASKADFYPTLNLAAMAGVVGSSLSGLFKSESAFTYAAPAISLPIFDGGRLRNQLAGSQADFDLAIANYDQAVLNALREVVDAIQSARALEAQIGDTRRARDAAAKSASLMAQRRQAGLANQLDVLDAQRPLLQLDQQLATLLARRIDTAVNLDIALGGGLPAAELPDKNDKPASP